MDRLLVGHHEVRIDHVPVPDARAVPAGAVRVVEAERARLQLAQADVAVHAGELLGEELFVALRVGDQHGALGHSQRALDGIGDPRRIGAVSDHQAVYHDVDRVPLLLVQVERLREVAYLAVYADADVPGPPGLLEYLPVLALAAPDHRRHDLDSAAIGHRQNGVDYLLDRLHLHPAAALVAMRPPRPGEEQAQVVVHLGHGAHGRARVARYALLVNGDCRRQPFDVVDVGLLHAAQELPRVCRERLYVPALPLRVDRVERQRALARPGHPRHDYQPVARYRYVDVLEVVLARALDDDVLQRQSGPPTWGCGLRLFYHPNNAQSSLCVTVQSP